LKKLTLLCFFILLGTTTCLAQGTASDEYNKFEFYGGFSHNRADDGSGEREGTNGIELAVTGNLSRYFGLKADFAHHRKSFDLGVGGDLTFTSNTFVAGVQIKDNSKETKVKPFVHAMVGGARLGFSGGGVSDSVNGFAGVFGGGIDIRAGKNIDIRVIQADYNPTRIEGTTQHSFRVGIGVVFH
jgi:hypothetical protein